VPACDVTGDTRTREPRRALLDLRGATRAERVLATVTPSPPGRMPRVAHAWKGSMRLGAPGPTRGPAPTHPKGAIVAQRTTLTRRRMLGLTAAAGATTAVAVSSGLGGPAAAQEPDPGTVDQPVDPLGVPSVIAEEAEGAVTVDPLDPAQAGAAEGWGAVPLVGFPGDVLPRTGDHVTVTDRVEDVPLAALPVCDWYEGVPDLDGLGRYAIGGQTTCPAEEIPARLAGEIEDARLAGTVVAACLLDTSLDGALVLEVRPPRTRATAGASS
jgi:hypothetical protein